MLSVFMTDPLGRKRSMIFVNIPLALGWLMIYQGDFYWKILTGCAFLGLGIGLMEAPIITYLGEICEPSTRDVLLTFTNISGTMGTFTIYFLNTLMPWRSVALFCLSVPMITAVAVCFIPETPQWLLSKNQTAEAEKSLRWLRGWVSNQVVAQEFHYLQQHIDRSKSCSTCIEKDLKCTHALPTLAEKFGELKRKRTLKPFFIIMSMFFIAQFSGMNSMRPFLVQIFKAYENPFPPDRTTAIMSFLEIFATLTFTCLVHLIGKRPFYLVMSFGIFISTAVLSLYGFILLPMGYISFERTHQSFHVENTMLPYIPLVCLFLWSFFSYCGFLAMPWMLLSEIFPFKSRGIASGVAAALNYMLGFITRKTYYNLEMTLSLPGASLFYCVICGCGFILMFLILPETENHTLEDIELHFSDDSKKITDRTIIKSNDVIPLNEVGCSVEETGSVQETEKAIENSLKNDSESGNSVSDTIRQQKPKIH
ncbi:facilitated trehalose transporter Tret1-like [Sitodiplosis mosellana]|uniref:facilitated trehalose transporter Tret1-like n=1 Tax=Sitodiplosis mosellana TaxID=263140 RepID=UPI00244375A4|nr:facilitated trehalose transporter Tret1-like [Sitodiplosis mosellana]